jgi:hypothetical protein
MRLNRYAILNEETGEVLTKSTQHRIITIEHINDFIETDVKYFPWLAEAVTQAKKYLTDKPNFSKQKACSVCGMSNPTNSDDTCTNCSKLDENVQRAFIALRATQIEQQEQINELVSQLAQQSR